MELNLKNIKRDFEKNGTSVVSDTKMQWLINQVEKLQKENEIYKTMLESSQGNTQAWVNKYNTLVIEIEKAFDNWALGNFDDERYHAEIQIIVHKLEK